MKITFTHPTKLLALLAVSGSLLLSACGGGGSSSTSSGSSTAAPVSLSGVVADGLIQGAQVCYDLNDNGRCDTGEPISSNTGANGRYTLDVPVSEAGKHAIIAIVPIGAVDSDTGTVTVAYTMKAPPNTSTTADIAVTPITTIVQEVMQASGATDPAAAIELVKQQLGMQISPLENYVALRDTNPDAARVGTIAQVITALKQEVGATAASAGVSETQTRALLSVVVVNNLTNLASSVASSTGSATVTAANLASSQGINSATVATQAQVASAIVSASTDTTAVTTGSFATLVSFKYSSPTSWDYRVFTGDNVVGSDGYKRTNDIRVNAGGTPYNRNASFYDSAASRWYECPSDGYQVIIYKDQTATTPGESKYCRVFADTGRRSEESIAGLTIASVVDRIRNSGLEGYSSFAASTNTLATPTAVFPAGSLLRYQINTRTATPYAHSLSNKVRVPKKTGTNIVFSTQPFAATLDEMIQHYGGNLTNASYNGGNTDGAGEIPDASYATANMQKIKNYRVAFQSTSTTTGNARFYQCRRNAGTAASPHNNTNTRCDVDSSVLLNTTYTIANLGDGRILTFGQTPAEIKAYTKNERVYVERGGAVFYGSKEILETRTTIRLNTPAWNAMRLQFPGVTAHSDPLAPVSDDSGVWVRDMREGTNSSGSDTFSIRAFHWTVNPSGTGGTSTEVRTNLIDGTVVPFQRASHYLIDGVWKASDSPDMQCPSRGIGISTFTRTPRTSIYCGYFNGSDSSFDVDLTGKAVSTTLADMRLYGSFDFGRDYTSYGPTATAGDSYSATFNAATFPAGSLLRYQVTTAVSSAPQFNTGSAVMNNTATFATIAAIRTQYKGGYTPTGTTTVTPINGGTTIGIYTYQFNGTPAAGTTGQKRLRLALDPNSSTNGTLYLCDQDMTTTFTINCVFEATTTVSPSVEGGKNMLRIVQPAKFDTQRGVRSFLVEHSGVVYVGSEDIANAKTYSQRLNAIAANAILRIVSGNSALDVATFSTCTAEPCTQIVAP